MKKPKRWLGLMAVLVLFTAGVWVGRIMYKTQSTPPPPPTFFRSPPAPDTAGASGDQVITPVSGTVIEVRDGELIQAAVAQARSGDLIRVYPGRYKETVYIDKENISLQGVIQEGKWPTLDGEKELNDAFLYSGNGILIENFKIVNYKGNGVMGQAGNNFVIRNNWVLDAGVYGIFPEFGKNGLIEHNILTGIEDAAIYVGMCDNVDVRHNEVYGNVAGIEIENSRHVLVENNHSYNNTGGILVFITPGLPIKTCYDVIVRNNFVNDNNHVNFGAPGSLVAGIPSGTGILVMAADQVTIENNIITGNNNAGITVTDLAYGANTANDPGVEPNPDRLVILDNIMIDNGNSPVGELKALMMTKLSTRGPDIVAVGGGAGSCIVNRDRYRTVGLGDWAQCQVTDTRAIQTYMLDKPIAPREISEKERVKMAYYGICSGCHAYEVRMVGPPTLVIQALYQNDPQGIADYIVKPEHMREDFPEMPPQKYLSKDLRLALAEYLLTV
ncbi:MAG: parallel beta-helix domain-containing protein, partial [Candidatus Marinimicrobia bacterium]|nr:parallel beta-helix domain-containing protein [Candidatus Neomarinimicrobiota bacterium]